MNKTVERTVRALEFIAASDVPVTMADVRKAVDLPKSTASEILNTLLDLGVLEYDNDRLGTLSAGLRYYEMSARFVGKNDLLALSGNCLSDLCRLSCKTACLFLLNQNELVLMEKVDSTGIAQPQINRLQRFSLPHCAAGHAVLAAGTPKRIRRLVGNEPFETGDDFPDGPITGYDALFEALAAAARRGYALHVGGSGGDLFSIAAPVLQSGGAPIAALGIVGFTGNIAEEPLDTLGKQAADSAMALSRKLGFTGNALYQKPELFE